MHDQASGGELAESLTKVIERHIDRTGDRPVGVLGRGAHINKGCAGVDGSLKFVPLDRPSQTIERVESDVTEHVHRILGRRELRRIGQFEVSELGGGDATGHRGRDDVDSLVDAITSHALCAENLVGRRVSDELE